MHDMTAFEQRLAERLGNELAPAATPFDPARIAGEAMAARSRRERIMLRLGLGDALPMPATTRRLVLALTVAALVVVTVALAVGLAPRRGDLALVRTDGAIVLANADGSDPRVIGSVVPSSLRTELAWAPDGEHVAAFGEDWLLKVFDRAGTTVFTRQLEDRGSRFAWSPDGRRLAILDGPWRQTAGSDGPPIVDPHLDIVAVDGTLESTIPLPEGFGFVIGQGYVAWAPDGTRLAITGHAFDSGSLTSFASSIWIVDTETNAVRELPSGAGATVDYLPSWLPDGGLLLGRMNSGIWRVDPATGAYTIVHEIERPAGGSLVIEVLTPSPDGTRVLTQATNGWLSIVDLRSGAVTDVPFDSDGAIDRPYGWTADGTALIVRWGPRTRPFFASSVGTLDLTSGKIHILASDVIMYDLDD